MRTRTSFTPNLRKVRVDLAVQTSPGLSRLESLRLEGPSTGGEASEHYLYDFSPRAYGGSILRSALLEAEIERGWRRELSVEKTNDTQLYCSRSPLTGLPHVNDVCEFALMRCTHGHSSFSPVGSK